MNPIKDFLVKDFRGQNFSVHKIQKSCYCLSFKSRFGKHFSLTYSPLVNIICFLLFSVRLLCFVSLAFYPNSYFNMISLLIYGSFSLKLGRKLTVISPHGFLLSFLARKIFLSFYVIYVIFNLFFMLCNVLKE